MLGINREEQKISLGLRQLTPDPWETLPKRLDELRGSDIYTLRRIIPADRGKDWG